MKWPWRRIRNTSERSSLTEHERAVLESHVKVTARLTPSSIASGNRLGGHPVLAESYWPRRGTQPLSFLACLDLADFKRVATDLDLSIGGTLSFFYEAVEQPVWGFDPSDRDGWCVIHTPAGAGHMIEAPEEALVFNEVPLKIVASSSIPDFQEDVLSPLYDSNADGLLAELEELDTHGQSGLPLHRVGGWPTLVQGALWLEAQLASNGINVGNPKGYEGPQAAALQDGAKEWRLLLQIDSDEQAGWMWGDCGMLYFVIREEDLTAGRFDQVWMILQCS